MKKTMTIVAVILASFQFAKAQKLDTVHYSVAYTGKGDTYVPGKNVDGDPVIIHYKERKKPVKRTSVKTPTATVSSSDTYLTNLSDSALEQLFEKMMAIGEKKNASTGSVDFKSITGNPLGFRDNNGTIYIVNGNLIQGDTTRATTVATGNGAGVVGTPPTPGPKVVFSRWFKKAMNHHNKKKHDSSDIAEMRFKYKEYDPAKSNKERRRRILFGKVSTFNLGMAKMLQLAYANDSTLLSPHLYNVLNTKKGVIVAAKIEDVWYLDFYPECFSAESDEPNTKIRVLYKKHKEHKKEI